MPLVRGPGPAPHESCVHRSEEYTSELQSRLHLVCRLLLEKKKNGTNARRRGGTANRGPQSGGPSADAVAAGFGCAVFPQGARARRLALAKCFFLMNGGPPGLPLFPYPPLFG